MNRGVSVTNDQALGTEALLYVDPDPAARAAIGEAFHRAGFALRTLAAPRQAHEAVRALCPELLLVRSEVRGPVLAQTLEALGAWASSAALPIALVCEDLAEAAWVQQLRTGVVALLPAKLPPQRLVEEVRALLNQLPGRSGTASGTLQSAGLAALVRHLRRTGRSGVLTVDAGTPEEGRALFARGTLRSAEHLGEQGMEALLAMVASPRAGFCFSELGAGAEALIDLHRTAGDEPLAPPGEEEVPIEVGDVATGEFEVPLGPGRRLAPPAVRLLLVDDDQALCRMFSLLFRKHGFEVVTAKDGLAGFEAARDGLFEAVVADLNMPRMDGWGMLRLLREDFRTRELPVAFLSCHDDYRETLKALEAGAQAYFSKATRLDALASQVRALLLPRQQVASALRAHPQVSLALGRLGPQWAVHQVAREKLSGTLEAKDGWAQYEVDFLHGAPVCALARAGRHLAEGQRALNALLSSNGAQGNFSRGKPVRAHNLQGQAQVLVARAVDTLNENERRLREGLMVQANRLQVNEELYALYVRVGPDAWLQTARLICEERLPPREVIARVDASPVEVEEALRDLVRRGVVTLSA